MRSLQSLCFNFVLILKKEAEQQEDAALLSGSSNTVQETASKPLTRACIVVNRYDKERLGRYDFDAEEPPKEYERQDEGQDTKHAFYYRKNVYEDEEENSAVMFIHNPSLVKLLETELRHRPEHDLSVLSSPFEPLIHNRDRLLSATMVEGADAQDRQARSDLKLLLETILKGSGDPKLDRYFKSRGPFQADRGITFEALWTIFPAGTFVVGRLFQEHPQLLIVRDILCTWPDEEREKKYTKSVKVWYLDCLTYDWNGQCFQWQSLTLEFEEFDGKKPISALPYYPLDVAEITGDLRQELMHRGKKLMKYCTAGQEERLCFYKGKAILESKGLRGASAPETLLQRDVLVSAIRPRHAVC